MYGEMCCWVLELVLDKTHRENVTRHYKILIPQFLRDKRLESPYDAPPFNSIDIVWERMSNDVEAGICPKSFVQNC